MVSISNAIVSKVGQFRMRHYISNWSLLSGALKPGEVKYNTQEVNMKPVVDSPMAEKKNYTNNNLLSAII